MEKELTILMPCLNEEKTIGICIEKAIKFIEKNQLDAEVLIVDNGSTDGSINIAKQYNVKIIEKKEKGYGNALIYGIENANSRFIILGDADDSYNFLEIDNILEKLRQGYDLVIGNRYTKNMEKNSMKFWHKYLGTPVISALLNIKYHANVFDVNSGLRGLRTKEIQKLKLKAEGMEFATEMIIKAQKSGLNIIEIPINFYKDKRSSKSHLNPVRDGIQHIKTIIFNDIRN